MREYNLATALLQFRHAYNELVKASKALPDYDSSLGYPFYLLDFEEIAPQVLAWCSLHAANLLKDLPDQVDNPACASCDYMRIGIRPSGTCKAPIECPQYPVIPFSRLAVTPLLRLANINIDSLSDDEVHLLYLERMEKIYEGKQKVAKAIDDFINCDDASSAKHISQSD